MKFLLDTHIWLWLAENPKRVGRKTYRALQNPENEIWISSISILEALILHEKRKVTLHGAPMDWLAHALTGTKEASLTHEVALVGYEAGSVRLGAGRPHHRSDVAGVGSDSDYGR